MLKTNRATSAESCGKYMKYVSFPWPPVVTAHNRKRLPEHCQAAEVTVYRRTLLRPRIKFYSSDPTILFKMCRRRFRNKIAFAMKITEVQPQTITRDGICLKLPVFSPWQLLFGILPILLNSQRYHCNY